MKFKVGDVVKVKDSFFADNPGFLDLKMQFFGKVMKVTGPNAFYTKCVDVDYGKNIWYEGFLEPVKPKSRIKFIYT